MPPPSAVISVGAATFAITIFLSSMTKLVLSILEVTPSTVRLPVILASPFTSNVYAGLSLKIPTRSVVALTVIASRVPPAL